MNNKIILSFLVIISGTLKAVRNIGDGNNTESESLTSCSAGSSEITGCEDTERDPQAIINDIERQLEGFEMGKQVNMLRIISIYNTNKNNLLEEISNSELLTNERIGEFQAKWELFIADTVNEFQEIHSTTEAKIADLIRHEQSIAEQLVQRQADEQLLVDYAPLSEYLNAVSGNTDYRTNTNAEQVHAFQNNAFAELRRILLT